MSYRANGLKSAKKQSQKCPNDLEDKGQGHPFSIGVERSNRCIFGANLVWFGLIPGEIALTGSKVPKTESKVPK